MLKGSELKCKIFAWFSERRKSCQTSTSKTLIWGHHNSVSMKAVTYQAPVVQTLNSAIHRINHYPADSVIDFRNTYRLDSDLSGG